MDIYYGSQAYVEKTIHDKTPKCPYVMLLKMPHTLVSSDDSSPVTFHFPSVIFTVAFVGQRED
jgi:hypothetical protein